MNRIVEVNVELGYAVIEAGVSQQQLYDHLCRNNIPLWLDCSGAGPDASLVGNTLDHGFGHTRYGDHFLSTCGMEIVLADGRVLDTGFGHFPGARTSQVYPYGVGPYLDGIFCQSNLGIVTRIGLWLMPKPEAFSFFYVKCDRDDAFPLLIDRLRELRMSGILQSAIHIANDLRILSGTGRYPWAEAGGAAPLPAAVRDTIRKRGGVGLWNAAGSITGTRGHVRASRKAIRRATRGLGRLVFVNDRKLALGEFAAKILALVGMPGLAEQLKALRPNYGLLKGIPTDEPLLGAQWRLRHPPQGPCDPVDVGCGLLWISPALPATGADAQRLLGLLAPIFARHGFDLLATFTLITERAMIAITNVSFDKNQPGETAAARACYDEAMKALIDSGYPPYRVGLAGLGKIHREGDVFWDVARRIKHALDPDDILARGRYIPSEDKTSR